MMVKKKKQAAGGAGHPQDNKPRRDYISSPSQECGCVHLIADRWGWVSTAPTLLSQSLCSVHGSAHLSAGTLGAHLSPVALWHLRCISRWSHKDVPSDLGSLWSTTPAWGLVIPPGGLCRQSIFHLSIGQLATLPLSTHAPTTSSSPFPSPRRTPAFGGRVVSCQASCSP